MCLLQKKLPLAKGILLFDGSNSKVNIFLIGCTCLLLYSFIFLSAHSFLLASFSIDTRIIYLFIFSLLTIFYFNKIKINYILITKIIIPIFFYALIIFFNGRFFLDGHFFYFIKDYINLKQFIALLIILLSTILIKIKFRSNLSLLFYLIFTLMVFTNISVQGLQLLGLIPYIYSGQIFFGLDRVPGIFLEASHFGIFIGPLLFFFYHYKPNVISYLSTYFMPALLFLSFSFCLSLTGIISILFALILILFLKFVKNYSSSYSSSMVIFLILIILVGILNMDYSYNRIIGLFTSTSNLSAFLLKQHTIHAYQSLLNSNLIGYGLNNYQFSHDQFLINPANVSYIYLHNLSNSENFAFANYNDGMTIFNKLVVEFGIVGFILVLCFLGRSLLFLFRLPNELDNSRVLYISFILVLLNLFFIRSAGYFHFGFIIFLLFFFLEGKVKDEKNIIC